MSRPSVLSFGGGMSHLLVHGVRRRDRDRTDRNSRGAAIRPDPTGAGRWDADGRADQLVHGFR